MQFTTTSQKAYVLEANAAGMNTAKNQQKFFEFRKTMRSSKHNKKLVVDDKETTDQTHILECIRNSMKLFLKNANKEQRQKLKVF